MKSFLPQINYAPADGDQGTPPPAKPGASLISQPPSGDPPAPPPGGALPDNWRDLMAAGDPDLATELQRHKTPTDLIKNTLDLKKRMRSGSFDVAAPGEDKPEELKTWRKEHGIPDEPTGYEIAEDVKKRFTDDDKPLMESFVAAAHKTNQPPGVVAFATKWYVDAMEAAEVAQADIDKKAISDAEEALREKWGPDFKRNRQAAINATLQTVPGVDWFEARLPDGRLLGSIPEFLEGMLAYALARWGDGSLVGEENTAKASGRMAEIEDIMRTRPDEYTQALKNEYYKLTEAQEAAKVRKAG